VIITIVHRRIIKARLVSRRSECVWSVESRRVSVVRSQRDEVGPIFACRQHTFCTTPTPHPCVPTFEGGVPGGHCIGLKPRRQVSARYLGDIACLKVPEGECQRPSCEHTGDRRKMSVSATLATNRWRRTMLARMSVSFAPERCWCAATSNAHNHIGLQTVLVGHNRIAVLPTVS
jgi:hypothetical protein